MDNNKNVCMAKWQLISILSHMPLNDDDGDDDDDNGSANDITFSEVRKLFSRWVVQVHEW